MKDLIGLSFEFRGKNRSAKAKLLKSEKPLFEIRWHEDDLIWEYGKRFYASNEAISLVGNQKPPKDAQLLHNTLMEVISSQSAPLHSTRS